MHKKIKDLIKEYVNEQIVKRVEDMKLDQDIFYNRKTAIEVLDQVITIIKSTNDH